MWWTVWSACQEPFGTDRHDLVGFRIAAVGVSPALDGETVRPRAAMIVDDRPWSEVPVEFTWFWVDDPDDVPTLDPLSVADAVGPEPELVVPEDRGSWGHRAGGGDRDARAVVEIAAPPPRSTARPASNCPPCR